MSPLTGPARACWCSLLAQSPLPHALRVSLDASGVNTGPQSPKEGRLPRQRCQRFRPTFCVQPSVPHRCLNVPRPVGHEQQPQLWRGARTQRWHCAAVLGSCQIYFTVIYGRLRQPTCIRQCDGLRWRRALLRRASRCSTNSGEGRCDSRTSSLPIPFGTTIDRSSITAAASSSDSFVSGHRVRNCSVEGAAVVGIAAAHTGAPSVEIQPIVPEYHFTMLYCCMVVG